MRNHVLAATGRTPRPLNEFEIKPLQADLRVHGGLREVRKKIRAYESAWARLQHDEPGFAQSEEDLAFERDLLQWLLFHQAMLIGEVIPQYHEYLRSNPGAQERSEYTHILVDEYQDLNKAEQAVIELLSGDAEVCIVGDDDQSIYSFKHAHPEGIREWVGMNPGADDITLIECRRCPTRVVDMANSLIARNQARPVARRLLPLDENGEGDVRIIQYATLQDEIIGVSDTITNMVGAGTPPGDILVLAQRGVIGTPIFQMLVNQQIPVRSYYAEAELDSYDAQHKFALLKLFVDQNDRVALRWLLGLGTDNWRAPAYHRIRERCIAENRSPWQVLNELADGGRAMPHVEPLVARFVEIREQLDELEERGDIRAVVDQLFPEDDAGTHGLREVSLTMLDEGGGDDRARFLSELVSAIATPEVPSEIEDVRIMSLHKSKGLSAPVTIIAGCVEGLLPMRPDAQLSPGARAAYLEEQRRLFYVGLSRVKASSGREPGTLILTYSQEMPLATAMGAGITPAAVSYGTARLLASRFIAELGPAAPRPRAG